MSPTRVLLPALSLTALTVLGGCGTYAPTHAPDARPAASPSASSPSTSFYWPSDDATYAPAPGDPKTHELRVLIRDVGGVDAYRMDDSERGCTSTSPKGFPHQLVISGPTKKQTYTPLASFDIPDTAIGTNGACEAELTVTVPYAPRYSMGIAMEGRGIATGYEPDPSWIETSGSSQKVVMLTQVTTVLEPGE